jgi:hypothetical protein
MGDLTPYFSLAELTKSQVALRKGIANAPGPAEIARLRALCVHVLEPVRAQFGRPVTISSGYRSPRLNRAIGGAPASQHCRGEAADIEIAGVANGDLAHWIRDHLSFDQLILEAYTPGQPASGWVHVSYRAEGCRAECLTWPGPAVGYLAGLQV